MKILKNGDLILESVNVNFANIAKPDMSKFGKGKYNITAFINKDDPQIKEIQKFIQQLLQTKKMKITDPKNHPLKDGDKKYSNKVEIIDMDLDLDDNEKAEKKQRAEYYKGMYMVKCANKRQPQVVGKNPKDVLDPEEIGLNGAICNLLVTPWAYSKETTGITFLLGGIQLLQEGSQGSTQSTAEDAFSMVETEETASPMVPGDDDSIFGSYQAS